MTHLRQAPHPLRFLIVFAVLSALLLSQTAAVPLAPPSEPDTIYGLRFANTLIRFSSSSPGTIDQTTPITGLLAGTTLVAIDFRIKTRQLYGIGISGTDGRLYTINPATGVASPVGPTPFATNLVTPAYFGMDFNPKVDIIRMVNDLDKNLRVNPTTGLLTATDTNLNRPSNNPTIVALAYDRTVNGVISTTAYGIDYALNELVMIGGLNGSPSPNGGVVSFVGPLGLTLQSQISGLDVSSGGVAYASLRANGAYSLYQINLSSGGATLIGNIGTGLFAVYDIAVVPRYSLFLPSVHR